LLFYEFFKKKNQKEELQKLYLGLLGDLLVYYREIHQDLESKMNQDKSIFGYITRDMAFDYQRKLICLLFFTIGSQRREFFVYMLSEVILFFSFS
jgi:hypothetical protein